MALKVGILTLPISTNYGGTLQAIALYRLLHVQGYEVVLIYKKSSLVLWKRIIIKILLKIPFHDFKNFKATYKEKKEKKDFHRDFIAKEILTISEDLYSKKDLALFSKKERFDAVIVGSDQVWRKAYINDKYYKSYFLDFLDGTRVKKIAYAASFGKNYWEGKDDIEDISKCLKDFSAVSTRELSGVDICKNSFKIDNVKHVLDPTLLMGKEYYLNDIIFKNDTSIIHRGRLVTYVLDEAEDKKEIINFIQSSLNIEYTNHLKGFNCSSAIYTIPQWLASFAYADMIITDSFHGMVFSIIFEKKFVVIGNASRGLDRFTSLLAMLGLEDRLVFSLRDIKSKVMKDIDYSIVSKILNLKKQKSYDFLADALNTNKGS